MKKQTHLHLGWSKGGNTLSILHSKKNLRQPAWADFCRTSFLGHFRVVSNFCCINLKQHVEKTPKSAEAGCLKILRLLTIFFFFTVKAFSHIPIVMLLFHINYYAVIALIITAIKLLLTTGKVIEQLPYIKWLNSIWLLLMWFLFFKDSSFFLFARLFSVHSIYSSSSVLQQHNDQHNDHEQNQCCDQNVPQISDLLGLCWEKEYVI